MTTLQLTEVDARDALREKCRRNAEFFVERFVQIEDRDSSEVAIPFKLWPKQVEVLKTFLSHRLVQVLKARQLGLTWLALVYAAWCMIFKIGFSVIALSKTETDAKELVRRLVFILSHLPEWLLPRDRWEATKETVTISHKEPSTFQSFPASESAGRSYTANLLLLDEWAFQQWATEIWHSVFPSVNRPTGGQVIGLSTIARGTLFEDLWTNNDMFSKVFLGWDSDPRRNADWYEKTKKTLGDATLAEYPATEDEALSIPGGAFFDEFRHFVHIKAGQEIPGWFRRYVTLDYGLDMLAAYWYYLDDRGWARIYREVYESGLVISDAARLIRESQRSEKIDFYYAPPDLFAKSSQTGKSSADVWNENGIFLTKTKNDFAQGCAAMKEWLKPLTLRDEQTGDEYQTARLTIDEDAAPNLVHSLLNIQKDPHKDGNVYAKEPHGLTHAVDSVRYFCTERTVTKSVEPKPARPITNRSRMPVSKPYSIARF